MLIGCNQNKYCVLKKQRIVIKKGIEKLNHGNNKSSQNVGYTTVFFTYFAPQL